MCIKNNNMKSLCSILKSPSKSLILRCGILSVVNQDSRKPLIELENFRKGLGKLNHRGPDDHGMFVGDNGRVILGHARLSIIDLVGGHQPISSEDGLVQVVVNGELYDYERIRRELQGEYGCNFKTGSDSEIALHLYLQHGISFVNRLRGEFAILIWDKRHETFFAIRDRFGIKPLYYCQNDGKLFCASEAKALLALGVPAKWNEIGMVGARHANGFSSIFDGINQVPPGKYLMASSQPDSHNEPIELISYWDYSYADRMDRETRSRSEMVKQVREKLLESISLRLRADVPVGVYLSGGLDSCSVLGMASHLLGPAKKLNAFTISFGESSDHDEYQQAYNQAKLSGANFNPITITSNNITDALESSIYHTELPTCNTHGAAKFLLSKAVRDSGMKVVLTGEGSDEIFAGYSFYRVDAILSDPKFVKAGVEEQKKYIEKIAEKNKYFFTDTSFLTRPRSFTDQMYDRLMGFPSTGRSFWKNFTLSNDFIRKDLQRDSEFLYFSSIPGKIKQHIKDRWEPLHSVLYMENRTMLPNYLLTVLGDRNEMANSIEARLPFLDHELVELVNHMPSCVKIDQTLKNGIPDLNEKWILKEAAKPFITDEIYQRQKHPFLAPPALFNPDSKLMEWALANIYGPSMTKIKWIDGDYVKAYVDNAVSTVKKAHSSPGGLKAALESKEILLSDLTRWDGQILILASLASLQSQFNMKS